MNRYLKSVVSIAENPLPIMKAIITMIKSTPIVLILTNRPIFLDAVRANKIKNKIIQVQVYENVSKLNTKLLPP